MGAGGQQPPPPLPIKCKEEEREKGLWLGLEKKRKKPLELMEITFPPSPPTPQHENLTVLPGCSAPMLSICHIVNLALEAHPKR